MPQDFGLVTNCERLPASVDYLVARVFRGASKNVVGRIYNQQQNPSLFQLYPILSQRYSENTVGGEHALGNWQPIEFDNEGAEPVPNGDPACLCKELYAARRVAAYKARGELEASKELANRQRAEADGTVRDCGCCFSDEPMNRMVFCDVNLEHVSGLPEPTAPA